MGVPDRSAERVSGYGWVVGLVVGTAWTALAPGVFGPVRAQELLFVLLSVVVAVGFAIVRLRYPEPATVSIARFRRVYRRLEMSPASGRVMRSVLIGPSRGYWAIGGIRRDRIRRLRTPLWTYLGAVTAFSIGFAVFWAPVPAYLTDVGFVDTTVFVLFLAANAGSAVCYERVGALSARFGSERAQLGALSARVVLFPAVAFVGTAAAGRGVLAALFLALGVTWAVVSVTSTGLIARLASPDRRGEAFGLYAAVTGIGTAVGSVIGGAVAARTTYLAAFVVAALAVAVGAGLVVASASGGAND